LEENNQKPRLRFKGFTEAWEQRKLGEIGTTYTGLSGKSKEDFGHGNAKFVTYMNVYSNPIAKIEGTENVEIDNSQNKVQYGDAFFTTSSETPDEVGMSSVWLENTNNMYLNSFCFGYRPTEKIEPYYLGYMLRSETMREKLIFLAQGISRYNISKNKVMEIKISLPKYEEQVKIGNFFKHLDNLITLHQRKCDKLVNVKKALLEKMFPNNGKNVPELRFSGFTEAWEQRKLKEITSVITKGTTPLDKSGTGNINFIKIENINPSSGIIESVSKITEEEHNGYLRRSQLKENDILFSIAGTLGRVSLINKGILPANTNQALAIIRLKECDLNYIKTFLKGKAISDFIKRNPTIGAQPNLSLEQVSNFEISYPGDTEAHKIGVLLDSLDHLITLHQHKLEKLKNVKKSLLDKMLV